MLKFSGFKKFIYLNNIDEDTLRKAINYFELRLVKKDEFLFHESEPSKFFAGLIKGKISFRKSKIFNIESGEIILRSLYKIVEKKEDLSNKKRKFSNKDSTQSIMTKLSIDIKDNQIENKRISVNNFQAFKSLSSNFSLIDQSYKVVKEYFNPLYYRVTEDEIFQAESGYCFGEWALIYNQPRSASVIALEDSVFFILDEKIFSKTFLKCLTSSEHRKKKFIIENLFPFNLYNERRNSLYKEVIPKSFIRNQVIFSEGEPADTIYLIYSGTFFLEKIFKNKIIRFKSVEKGTILGLESIFEEEEKEKKYKCTMKLSSLNEFGIVACCKISKLVPYVIQKMKHAFKNNYELYLESNKYFYIRNINYENNILFKKMNQREENPEILNKYIEDCSLAEKYEKIKNKKIKFNTLKQTQLKKEPTIQRQNTNLDLEISSKKRKKKKHKRKNKKSRTIKLKPDLNYSKFTDEKNQICLIFRKKKVLRRMNTIAPFIKKINLNKEEDIAENTIKNDINKTPNLKVIESNKENDLLNSMKTRKINVDLYLKDLLSYSYKPTIFEDLKEKSKNNKIKLKTEESKKSFNKTFYNTFNHKSKETPLSRNKHEIDTEDKEINYTELPTIKSNRNFKFNSGKFQLPLMAQIFK